MLVVTLCFCLSSSLGNKERFFFWGSSSEWEASWATEQFFFWGSSETHHFLRWCSLKNRSGVRCFEEPLWCSLKNRSGVRWRTALVFAEEPLGVLQPCCFVLVFAALKCRFFSSLSAVSEEHGVFHNNRAVIGVLQGAVSETIAASSSTILLLVVLFFFFLLEEKNPRKQKNKYLLIVSCESLVVSRFFINVFILTNH